MSTPRVLIDAANLHSGGGLQVAASFLDELAIQVQDARVIDRFPWLAETQIEASSAVLDNIAPSTATHLSIRRRDRRPSDRQLSNWTARPAFDVTFSVFGPIYSRPRGRRNIVGFADGTSIYPVPEIEDAMSRKQRAVSLLRRSVSRTLFSRADRIIVEAPHVREQLKKAWNIAPDKVTVVPNCLNAVFTTTATATATATEDAGGDASLDVAVPPQDAHRTGWVYVTRSHPHKNLPFLGVVGDELHRRGVTDVTFVLTLTEDEWQALDPTTKRHSRTVGAKRVEELPALYASCEGSAFPSLLESYSAAPLEAVSCGLPLVASDRDYVRDVVADAALYADPRDAAAWADAILTVRTDAATRDGLAAARGRVLQGLSDARSRADAYLAIIDDEVSSLCQSQ